MNAKTIGGSSIGTDGRGVRQDGSSMGRARWLIHAPRREGNSVDDSAPFSGGCFIPTSFDQHMRLMNFLEEGGLNDDMIIRGQIIESYGNNNQKEDLGL